MSSPSTKPSTSSTRPAPLAAPTSPLSAKPVAGSPSLPAPALEAPKPAAAGGYSDVLNRVGFTLLMAYGFLALVAQGIRYVIPAVQLIEIMMFREVLRINQKERKDRQMSYFRILPWYLLGVTVFSLQTVLLRDHIVAVIPAAQTYFYNNQGIICFGLYCLGFVGFVLSLRRGMYKYQIGQFTWITMTLIFIIGQGALQFANMQIGMFWFLLPTSCVVHNDVWAYVCGKLFGRTKLLKLSPKKTLEGFIGAWLVTMCWAFWFAGFMPRFNRLVCPEKEMFGTVSGGYQPTSQCEMPRVFIPVATPLPAFVAQILGPAWTEISVAPAQWHAIVFAAFSSLIAPFGGFFASGLKRAHRLKDFGDLIPGHGGMTDRMDCQIIMGFFTFVYLNTVLSAPAAAGCPATVDGVLECIKALSATQQQAIRAALGGLA